MKIIYLWFQNALKNYSRYAMNPRSSLCLSEKNAEPRQRKHKFEVSGATKYLNKWTTNYKIKYRKRIKKLIHELSLL